MEFYHAIYTSVIDSFECRCVIQNIHRENKRAEKPVHEQLAHESRPFSHFLFVPSGRT